MGDEVGDIFFSHDVTLSHVVAVADLFVDLLVKDGDDLWNETSDETERSEDSEQADNPGNT